MLDFVESLKNLSDLIKTVDNSAEDINNFMKKVKEGEGYNDTNKKEFKNKLNALKGPFIELNKLMLSIYDFISKRKEEGIDIQNLFEGNKDKEDANELYNKLLDKIVRDSYNSNFIYYEDSKKREKLTIPKPFPENFNYNGRGSYTIYFMKNPENHNLPFFGETEYIPPNSQDENNTRLRVRGKKLKKKQTKRKLKRKPTKRKQTKKKPIKRKPIKKKPTKRKPTKRKPTKRKQTKKKSSK